jgi:hypothetical protein
MKRCARVLGVVAVMTAFSAGARGDPALRVVGAKDGVIALAVDGATLERNVTIVADNTDPPTPVVVTVSPFEDASGNQAPVALAVYTLPAITIDKPATLKLAATFPRPGSYSAELGIIVAQRRTMIRIDVHVTATALALEPASTTPAIRTESDKPHVVRIATTETAGKTWTVGLPRLTRAVIREGERWYQIAAAVASVRLDDKTVEKPFEVTARDDFVLDVDVIGFDSPGEYEGTIRLSADGATPVDIPFVMTVRKSIWWAIGFIALGVIASTFLRLWYGGWRGRLEAQRALATLDERLVELTARATTDAGRTLVRTVRAHVDDLRGRLRTGTAGDLPEATGRLSAKLPVLEAWLDADAMVTRLPAGTPRDTLRATLDGVAATLSRPSADVAAITTADQLLVDLRLRDKWRSAVTAELERTRAVIAEGRAGGVPAVLKALRDEVDPALAQVDQLLAADDLEALTGGALATLQRTIVTALAAGLTAALAQRPDWATSDAWKQLAAKVADQIKGVAEATTAESALAAYRKPLLTYLATAATMLADVARSLAEKIEGIYGRTATDLRALATSLDAARATATVDNVDGLSRAFMAATSAWPKLIALSQGQDAELVQVSALSVRTALPQSAWFGSVSRPMGERLTARAVHRQILVTELIAMLVLGVIAIATGVNLLWVDDPTWGGAKAYILALLWGVGLHQVGAGPAFNGLSGMAARITGG